MDGHRRLRIWQHARELVAAIYSLVGGLPSSERYIVRSQLLRAAWSVQNNIAEGNAKLGRAELRRFLDVSLGSLAEIDSMVSTLRGIYQIDPDAASEIERLRIQITAGIFKILKQGR